MNETAKKLPGTVGPKVAEYDTTLCKLLKVCRETDSLPILVCGMMYSMHSHYIAVLFPFRNVLQADCRREIPREPVLPDLNP